jgi:two-component system chemotaxis sensor kinase CheA
MLTQGRTGGVPFDELQAAVLDLQRAVGGDECPEETAGSQTEISPGQDRELMTDFIVESREHLAAIEAQVLRLERDACDSEAINAAFRGFHSIKGLAGFLELGEIQKLSHEVEAVLDRARNGQLAVTPPAIDVILASADHLVRWLAHLEARLDGRESSAPDTNEALFIRIAALQDDTAAAPSPLTAGMEALSAALRGTATEAPVSDAASREFLERRTETAGAPRRHEAAAVRVDTQKLDFLVDMAGEMVIAESLVRHDPDLIVLRSQKVQRNLAQLTRITAELQKTAMAMRLVPIGPLFRRMARLVRDLGRQFGKSVEMVTEGDEIELDRTIVEELSDPLMHMVRNALDHVVDTPAERARAGKSECARVTLKAQHRAGQVVVEIADDGRGLNREKIAATAVERGLIASAEGMADTDVYNLIFEPGFSTAAQVTNVSGRGVGMDVVRRHIEKLRGRIEIRSTPGVGTTFYLKLPLTLAIIDGLVVMVGAERYIVPMFAVREMFRPKPETLWTVEERGEMALVRGALLPVLRLYRRFGVKPRSEDPLESVLIVVEVEGQRFGMLVDDLVGKQEVVIKGLGDLFKQVAGVSGGAILGDGRVGLILDMDRLYRSWIGDANR